MVSAKHHEIRPYFTSTRGWKWWGLTFIQMFLILMARTGLDWEPYNLSVLRGKSTLTSGENISPSLTSGLQELNSKQHFDRQQRKWLVAWKVNSLGFLRIFPHPTAIHLHQESEFLQPLEWRRAAQGSRTGLTTGAPGFLGSKPHVYRLCTGPKRTKDNVFWWKRLWTMCWKLGHDCCQLVCHYMMNIMAKHFMNMNFVITVSSIQISM